MTRVGVMIEADAIKTDAHHQGASPEAFPGSAPFWLNLLPCMSP